MNIEHIGPNPISQPGAKGPSSVYSKYSSKEKEASVSISGKDQASLSESARILAKAHAALNETPDVRAELVDQLREEIQSGQYAIPYDKLSSLLANRLNRTY